MKKALTALLALCLALLLLAGCGGGGIDTDSKTLKVGASVTPHAEILEVAKELLAKDGITLEIVEYDDYVLPNTSTENGDLDANFFQHKPYLDEFNTQHGTHLVSVAAVHYEPLGIYSDKYNVFSDIGNGATIAVPNDGSNEARALFLLENLGLITLKDNTNFSSTILDIESNPYNLQIIEMAAPQLAVSLPDLDFAVINGNYALQAGLRVSQDSLAYEGADSFAADTYANILVVKEGNENNELILALAAALRSPEVKNFIYDNYSGSVLPKF